MAPRRSGNRVSMHNTTLELVIPYAYHVSRGYTLEGDLNVPDNWKWFDIEAVAPGPPTDDQIRLMFQSLLEDRFKLRVHHETQQREVYALVSGKRRREAEGVAAGRKATQRQRQAGSRGCHWQLLKPRGTLSRRRPESANDEASVLLDAYASEAGHR